MSSQSIPLSTDPLIVALFGLTGLHFFAPEEESNGSGSGDEADDGHAQCNQIDNGSLAVALLQQKNCKYQLCN